MYCHRRHSLPLPITSSGTRGRKSGDEHAIKNSNEFEEEINYMVNAAFESSDNNDGLLSFDEFVKWLFNTPEF